MTDVGTAVHPVTWQMVVLTLLAVHRLTLLVTRDELTKRAREWVDRKYSGSLVTLLFCPWCMSVWVAGGAVPLTIWQWWWWGWVALGLSASSVAGVLAELA